MSPRVKFQIDLPYYKLKADINRNKKSHIKMHCPTVRSVKSAAVLTRTGHFPSFFVPAAGNWQLKCSPPKHKKKIANARWFRGAGVMDAPGID